MLTYFCLDCAQGRSPGGTEYPFLHFLRCFFCSHRTNKCKKTVCPPVKCTRSGWRRCGLRPGRPATGSRGRSQHTSLPSAPRAGSCRCVSEVGVGGGGCLLALHAAGAAGTRRGTEDGTQAVPAPQGPHPHLGRGGAVRRARLCPTTEVHGGKHAVGASPPSLLERQACVRSDPAKGAAGKARRYVRAKGPETCMRPADCPTSAPKEAGGTALGRAGRSRTFSLLQSPP